MRSRDRRHDPAPGWFFVRVYGRRVPSEEKPVRVLGVEGRSDAGRARTGKPDKGGRNMRGRAICSLLTAVAFAAYSVFGLSASYASPKPAVVEVKPGILTGKVMDMDEKPLEGRSVKILDAAGKVRYTAVTDKDGTYSIEGLAAGNYTLILGDTQQVSLVVKAGSNNTVVNAMLPVAGAQYAAGAMGGLSTPLIVAIAGGVILIGV